MKKFSKILSVALLVALVLSLGVANAFAAGEGKITVTQGDANKKAEAYEAYRIFDVTAAKDGENYIMDGDNYASMTYTINSNWTGFFASGAAGATYIVDTNDPTANGGKGYTPIVVNGVVKYIALTDSNIADFAKAAFAYSQVAANSVPVIATSTTGVFTDLNLGYYMIYPKGADINVGDFTSIVSLTTTDPEATVVQKAEYPTLEKVDDDDSVELGQVVTYTLTAKVPDTTGFETFDFNMHDQMTAGLTFNGADSITVKIENGENDVTVPKTGNGAYTFAAETPAEGFATAFKISIPVMDYQDYIGKVITVTYTATVNDAAVVHVDKNHAYLEYSNNPKNDKDHTTTPPDEEIVYSAKIIINKYDGTNTSAKLEGAKFILRCKSVPAVAGQKVTAEPGKYYVLVPGAKNDDQNTSVDETLPHAAWVAEPGVTEKVNAATPEAALVDDVQNGATIVTTDGSGAASFDGLENGVYELIEVEAPAGYNQIKGVAAQITVNGSSESDLSYKANVANNSGSVLPSTGGIGTTIFYVVGGVLVLAAIILLVTKKRMSE